MPTQPHDPKGIADVPSAEQQKREQAAADFGWSLAVINSNPELRKAFKAAVDNGWTAARFIAEIKDTKWFQDHGTVWAQNQVRKAAHPEQWKLDVAAKQAEIKDAAQSLGAILTDHQLGKVTDNIMMFGWNEAQTRNALSNYVRTYNTGALAGQYIGDAGKNAAALSATAMRNGYRIPKDSLGSWNKAILRGDRTVADYQTFIRNQAATSFPTFAAELKAGADLEDLASPYKSSMADILELNPNSITMFDPTIRKAMASKDAQTGKPVATPIYDFENSLRADPRWMKTAGAHKELIGMGQDVLRRFGLQA